MTHLDTKRVSSLCGLLGLLVASGCGGGSGGDVPTTVTRRAGSVLVDGCSLDAGQDATLRAAPARQVLSEVMLLCLSMQSDGSIGLRDGFSTAMLSSEIATLKAEGYRVTLGVTAVDAKDDPLPAQTMKGLLAQAGWRGQIVTALTGQAQLADGLELAPPQLDDTSRADMTALVTALGTAIRPGKTLGVFAPPSVMVPSDIPGGDAFDLPQLAPSVDRVRLMTLDFSCCNVPPGPTIDAGWAIDAASLAQAQLGGRALDVAMPLYGTDFTAPGGGNSVADASVTYDGAKALAAQYGTTPARGPGDAPHFGYRDAKGNDHQVWYDDARSTLRTLAAWPPDALSPAIGVVYYGLGAEDPTLWTAIAQAAR